MAPVKLTGGCACGAVRYEADAAPLVSVNCHCRDCRSSTGSAFASVLGVPVHAFRYTAGAPRTYHTRSAAGAKVARNFCGDCGSPLAGLSEGHPEMMIVYAGSLDDSSIHRPGVSIFTEDLEEWARPAPGQVAFPGSPPGAH